MNLQTAELLLCIDAGNTRVKWALMRKSDAVATAPIAQGHCRHTEIPQLAEVWQQALPLTATNVLQVWAANVAGAEVAQALSNQVTALGVLLKQGLALHWGTASNAHPSLINGYRQPAQLGGDRWLGALGARQILGARPLLIVSCGTATTIDAIKVNAQGESCFSGGVILPGLSLMLRSLAQDTAQLPQANVNAGCAPDFADNTHAALAHGCLMAQLGTIEYAWRHFAEPGGLCVLTGGAQQLLAPHLRMPLQCFPNLVLEGLRTLAQTHQHT